MQVLDQDAEDQDAEYTFCVECGKPFLMRASSRTLCRRCDEMLEAEDAAERAADNRNEERP